MKKDEEIYKEFINDLLDGVKLSNIKTDYNVISKVFIKRYKRLQIIFKK